MKLFPSSFRNRLALLFVGLAFIVGAPAYWYIDQLYFKQLVTDHGYSLRDHATAIAAVMYQYLRESQHELTMFALSPSFRDAPFDSTAIPLLLEQLQRNDPHYSWIALADRSGVVRAATGGLLVGSNVGAEPWFISGRRHSWIGDLRDAGPLGALLPRQPGEEPPGLIDVAAPVLDATGGVRGVMVARTDWRWMTQLVEAMTPRNAKQEELEILIVNGDNRILYPERAAALSAPATPPAGRPFVLDRGGNGRAYVTTVIPVPEMNPAAPLRWRVVMRQPVSHVMTEVDSLQRVVVVFALTAATLFLLLAWWAASRISRPLEQLAGLAKRIEEGDESVELQVRTGSMELRSLVEAVRGMAATLINRREALAATNVRLEQQVAERTAELSSALERMTLSETLYRTFFEQSPLGITLVDTATGRIRECNKRFTEIIGRPLEELAGLDWKTITHPDDLAMCELNIARLESGEISGYRLNKRYLRPDGVLVWVNLTVALVFRGDDQRRSLLALVEDITERRESEERLRCVTDTASDAILMMNPQGEITFWNPAAEKILGYSAGEALGQNLHELLTSERDLAAHLAAIDGFRRTGQGPAMGKTVELSTRRKDGVEIPVALSLAAVRLQGGGHAVGILRDIIERKEYECALEQARTAAETANQAKSEFLANMSHEIRTPLNGIMGMAQLLDYTEPTEEQQEYLDAIRTSSLSLLSLINDVLDLSKIESGKIELEHRTFSLRGSVSDVVKTQISLIHGKGLSVRTEIPADVPDSLTGDQLRVKQILLNLLGNAIKFTDRGGIVITVSVEERRDDSALLEIGVTDTGVGISPEALKKIFDPFVQADSSTTRQYGGTGLGLAICTRLAELMGGSIRVESREGGQHLLPAAPRSGQRSGRGTPRPEERGQGASPLDRSGAPHPARG